VELAEPLVHVAGDDDLVGAVRRGGVGHGSSSIG
jgi:hypothetical protein